MTDFKDPHVILDGFESLCRHHFAKQTYREKQLVDLPYDKIPKDAQVLDIGCGPGLYMDFWAQLPQTKNWTFHLLDHSQEALDICIKNARDAGYEQRMETHLVDIYDLQTLGTDRFDFIFIGNTFEYLRDPIDYMSQQITPILKRGCVFAIRDLDCGILGCNHVNPALCAKIIAARILGCQEVSKPGLETFHDPFIGRNIGALMAAGGFEKVVHLPYFCQFQSPLSESAKIYLSAIHTTWYLEDRCQFLSNQEKEIWFNHFDLNQSDCVLNQDHFFYIESEFLCYGSKP